MKENVLIIFLNDTFNSCLAGMVASSTDQLLGDVVSSAIDGAINELGSKVTDLEILERTVYNLRQLI